MKCLDIRNIIRTGAVAILLAGLATAAFGQPLPTADLQEITVIAKKRLQNSSQVDISLTVVNPESLQSLNILSLPDAISLVENVSLFEDYPGAGIPTWVIRGVGLQDFNSNNTPTAAIYMDGAYQVATVMGAAGLFDVQTLEVLKGPQGGLYGRNTSGGAVLLNSNRAQLDESVASFTAGAGNWGRQQFRGVVNQPLGSDTAIRFALQSETGRDAWQDSFTSMGTQGDKGKLDFRSWLRHDFSKNMKLELKVQAGRDNSDIPLGRSIGLYDSASPGKKCTAVLAGRRDDSSCINFAGVNKIAFGTGTPEVISAQARDGSLVYSDLLNRQDNDYVSTVAELSWSNERYTLMSLTSFDRYGYGVELDLDASNGEYGHRFSSSDINSWSQEFRIQSPAGSRSSWIAGLSISKDSFEENRDFRLSENRLVGLGRGKLRYEQTTRSVSAYIDTEVPLSDRWAINSSLRATQEDKEYRNGDFWIPAARPIYLARNLEADYSLDSHLAGSISLNWQPGEQTYLYLKYASGFKSGGFYGGFPFNPAEIEPYKEETIGSWEGGVKIRLPEQAMEVNLAVFHYDYRDVQGFIRDINPLTGTGIDRLSNQGDAVHDGVEVQWLWIPVEHFSVQLGMGWLDARFRDSGIQTVNLAGNLVNIRGTRTWAPDFNGNILVNYTFAFQNQARLVLTGSYDYRSEFAGYQSSPVDMAINRLPGYGLLNLGATLSLPDKPLTFGLWMRNASDKAYVSRVKNDGLNSFMDLFGEPRSFGINLEYQL